MITSFFGKTKPINYVIVVTFLFLFYWLVHFSLFKKIHTPEELLWQMLMLLFLSFSIFLVDFIVKKNRITFANSYTILFFTLLMVVFPETLTDSKAILSNTFILLALRRIIGMRSLKGLKGKIFDASLWIFFASFFYDWAILFLLLVFLSIYIYEPKGFRNWLVPLAAFFTAFMLSSAFLVLIGKLDFLFTHYTFSILFDFGNYLKWANSGRLIIYGLALFILIVLAFINLGNSGVGKIITMRLVVFFLVLGLILNGLVSSEEQHPILLTFFPGAVLMSSYVESIKRVNIREIVLLVSILAPFIVFLSTMVL